MTRDLGRRLDRLAAKVDPPQIRILVVEDIVPGGADSTGHPLIVAAVEAAAAAGDFPIVAWRRELEI